MKINFSLDLNQSQKLILTKELKQSLEILNMNSYELEEVIIKENEENPTVEMEKKQEIDWEKYIRHMEGGRRENGEYKRYEEEEEFNIENIIKYNITLYEHLKEQINYYRLSGKDRKIIEYIIDSLDEDGYLRIDVKEIEKDVHMDEERILNNLKIVQSLDPSGVGARSLEECLLIQIKEKQMEDKLLEDIIREDLRLLGNKKYKEICKKYKIKIEECVRIHDMIKTLEPKPGRKYAAFKNKYITPDVIVEKVGEEFVLYLNEGTIPSIKINNFYKEVLRNIKEDPQAKEYIKEKLNAAANLMKNIESRKNTILKIANEILKEQKEFFERGNKYLKPLIMKDIAENLGFHESTVSRGVNGKYMLTPYGLYELKYFFSSGLKDGEDIAATSIKNIIKEIIDSENKKSPHSDQKICGLLNEKNINISRRTVAKYREELGIESSSKRKSY